jgi:hypothetical protein
MRRSAAGLGIHRTQAGRRSSRLGRCQRAEAVCSTTTSPIDFATPTTAVGCSAAGPVRALPRAGQGGEPHRHRPPAAALRPQRSLRHSTRPLSLQCHGPGAVPCPRLLIAVMGDQPPPPPSTAAAGPGRRRTGRSTCGVQWAG